MAEYGWLPPRSLHHGVGFNEEHKWVRAVQTMASVGPSGTPGPPVFKVHFSLSPLPWKPTSHRHNTPAAHLRWTSYFQLSAWSCSDAVRWEFWRNLSGTHTYTAWDGKRANDAQDTDKWERARKGSVLCPPLSCRENSEPHFNSCLRKSWRGQALVDLSGSQSENGLLY